MVYEVPITAVVYVSMDAGGPAAAKRLVRDHVLNDWLLRTREGSAPDAGHFLLKGQVGDSGEPAPFRGTRLLATEPVAPEDEGIF